MKLSELLEKYGDIEIDNVEFEDIHQKVSREKIEQITLDLIESTSMIISTLTEDNPVIELSKEWSVELIKDRKLKLHLIDMWNNCKYEIDDKYTLFLSLLYYATDSEYCFNDCSEEELENFIDIVYENQDLEVLDRFSDYINGLSGKILTFLK